MENPEDFPSSVPEAQGIRETPQREYLEPHQVVEPTLVPVVCPWNKSVFQHQSGLTPVARNLGVRPYDREEWGFREAAKKNGQ